MTDTSSGAHLSDYALARIHAREADHGDEAHLASCAACRERLEAIATMTAELRRELPVSRLLAARSAATSAQRSWLISPRLLVGLAAAAACLLMVSVAVLRHGGLREPAGGRGAGVRLKGAYQVEWVVVRGGEQQRAERGFVFEVGDRIGLRVRSPRGAVAQAFSVDARGKVELLIPAPSATAPEVAAGEQLVLPNSLELEAPLETRRLFVVLAARAYRPAELDRAIRHAPRGARNARDVRQLELPGLLYLDSRWIPGGKR